jgi:hypothetical protein
MSAIFNAPSASGQEQVGPLMWNPLVAKTATAKKAAKKTTATLALPFFEDFTGNSPSPDSNKWVDFEVFINNTMAISPISRGVATFDALSGAGIPYDSFNNTVLRHADSLTSQPIDLSTETPTDSLYLSFFYQAQGNGYFPQPGDSLMLYMKNRYGEFIKIWSIPGPAPGTAIQPFTQVMIPITDTLYLHSSFQFRFVNIASLYWADAIWNVDYVRLDKNRSIADTAVKDIAFTANPTFLLNDYTSMPYSQFKANPASEIASEITDSVRNNAAGGTSVNYSYTIKDGSFTLAGSAGPNSIFVPGYQTISVTKPLAIAGYPSHPAYATVVYETKHYLDSSAATGPAGNDTIVSQQVFANFLSYDDGTAEKSYYLNLLPSLPGKIAIEYHLNRPDTMQGMAIYFGRQIPFSGNKPFQLNVYSTLAGVNGNPYNTILHTTDVYYPTYADSVNHFWVYKFDSPLFLPAGTFYAGATMSAKDGSDSLYFGLDVNRIGGNHAYFDVVGNWSPSLIAGAIMIRPIIGRSVADNDVNDVDATTPTWQVLPNPATDDLKFLFKSENPLPYNITDMLGRSLKQGFIASGKTVVISDLSAGIYFVTLGINGTQGTQKIIKL